MDEQKPKKPKGWAALNEDQRRLSVERRKATMARKRQILASPGIEDIRNGLERNPHETLDRMKYSKDPREATIWSTNPDLSPLHIPNEIREKYPEFEFKWCSTKKIDKRGGTGPWEIFKDKVFSKDGKIRRADDTILAVMPKELHEKTIARPKAERAEAALLGLEENRMEEMERRASAARQGGDEHAEVLHNVTIHGRTGATGIRIGRHQLANRSARLRSQFEKRITEKKYFDLGGR